MKRYLLVQVEVCPEGQEPAIDDWRKFKQTADQIRRQEGVAVVLDLAPHALRIVDSGTWQWVLRES